MLVDTFPRFLKEWNGTVDSWLRYIRGYPELFGKVKWDYERYGMDWKGFTKLLLKRNMEELILAHEKLLEVLPRMETKIEELFGIKPKDYNVVLYIGIENGAGWVTEFLGKPPILFGLEAIAKLKWYSKLEGLVVHEFGHLVHWLLRGENIERLEDEQMFLLYTEGFAQRIEDIIIGRPWHLEEEGWFEWCEENEGLLKAEFLRRIQEKEPLNPFFGSWYTLFGKRFLGYYIGYKFICWLEKDYSLEEISKLKREEIKGKILKFLP
ncbi:hypothetical protein [Thermococcus kodakarensis]|nr:hypothetical protein [Thermococcus kodakarensis]WCN28973.1 hypothetical protein POG15_05075 [Thermococcus kodakarensis]WCN31279.1 hypothetical protein POG21_05075 [Thermococcus kodakarensis]